MRDAQAGYLAQGWKLIGRRENQRYRGGLVCSSLEQVACAELSL